MKTTRRTLRRTIYVLIFVGLLAAAGLGTGARLVQADVVEGKVFLPLISTSQGGTIPSSGQ